MANLFPTYQQLISNVWKVVGSSKIAKNDSQKIKKLLDDVDDLGDIVNIVKFAMQKIHEIFETVETVETVRGTVSQKSQLSHAKIRYDEMRVLRDDEGKREE